MAQDRGHWLWDLLSTIAADLECELYGLSGHSQRFLFGVSFRHDLRQSRDSDGKSTLRLRL